MTQGGRAEDEEQEGDDLDSGVPAVEWRMEVGLSIDAWDAPVPFLIRLFGALAEANNPPQKEGEEDQQNNSPQSVPEHSERNHHDVNGRVHGLLAKRAD